MDKAQSMSSDAPTTNSGIYFALKTAATSIWEFEKTVCTSLFNRDEDQSENNGLFVKLYDTVEAYTNEKNTKEAKPSDKPETWKKVAIWAVGFVLSLPIAWVAWKMYLSPMKFVPGIDLITFPFRYLPLVFLAGGYVLLHNNSEKVHNFDEKVLELLESGWKKIKDIWNKMSSSEPKKEQKPTTTTKSETDSASTTTKSTSTSLKADDKSKKDDESDDE